MVSIQACTLQQRHRRLRSQEDNRLFGQVAQCRVPKITYGRSTKMLSLTARQFRAGTQVIPPDKSFPGTESDVLLNASAQKNAQSLDSSLSDAGIPSPRKLLSSCQGQEGLHQIKTSDRVTSRSRDSTENVIRISEPKSTSLQEQAARRKHLQRSNEVKRDQKRLASLHEPRAKRRQAAAPKRRLPVKELILVTSPRPSDSMHDREASVAGIEKVGSLHHHHGSIHQCSTLSARAENESLKTSLSNIRHRLRRSSFKYKIFKPKRVGKILSFMSGASKIGDGFEGSERAVRYPFSTRRPRKRKDQAPHGYFALQMCAGRLPDVDFLVGKDEVQLGAETQQLSR